MTQEVIALLMPDTEAGPARGARPVLQALVRREDGAVVLEDVADPSGFDHRAVPRFREAEPILDPQTREVVGYELQPVAVPN